MTHARFPAMRYRAFLALTCATIACHTPATPAPLPVQVNLSLQQQPPLVSLSDHALVPMPLSVKPAGGEPFVLSATSTIVVSSGGGEPARIGEMLGALLRPSTGFRLPVTEGDGKTARKEAVAGVDQITDQYCT